MQVYATEEIEAFMSRTENLPQFATKAQDFIRDIHSKYAPSNSYDPKTFDHTKELGVRRLFEKKSILENAIQWSNISR